MESILDKSFTIRHFLYLVLSVLVIVVITLLVRFNLKAGDIIIAFSTLASPLIALQIQTYIEKIKTEKSKKMEIFKILMATRTIPLSFDHVKAINMVSVEFYGDNMVIDAWKEYMEVRKPKNNQDSNILLSDPLNSPLVLSLVNLLQKMALSLGLDFHDDEIINGCYRPQAHVDLEENKKKYWENLLNSVKDGKLHVTIDNPQIENKV